MGLNPLHGREKQYVGIASLVFAVLASVTVGFNMLVDPLWMLGGNRFDHNFVFNERTGKAHLFMRHADTVDCLILGSSRTTLLDATQIEEKRCFNFSFSAGSFEAYGEFAKWVGSRVAHRGADAGAGAGSNDSGPIDLVIVGVDGYNLGPDSPGPETSDYIKELKAPPFLLSEYADQHILRASIRAALGYTFYHRAYDENFRGFIFDDAPEYEPPTEMGTPGRLPSGMRTHVGPFGEEGTPRLERLRAVFPAARYVGYVPPIHPVWVAQMRALGTLDGYLDAIYTASRVFDTFYDFSVPAALNANTAYTYDGSHYGAAVNDRIARVLSGSDDDYGLEIRGMQPDEYKRAFHAALNQLSADRQH